MNPTSFPLKYIYPSFTTTGKAMLIEGFVELLTLLFIGIFIELPIVDIGYWVLPLIIPFTGYSLYKVLTNSSSFNSEVSFVPSNFEIFGMSLLWMGTSVLLMYKTQLHTYFLVPIILGSMNIYRMYLFQRLYETEPDFHIDMYSRTANEWIEASTTLTRSINLRKNDSIYSIFWAILSIGRYVRLHKSIDANRDEYELQGAEDYITAARENLKICIKQWLGTTRKENIYLFKTAIRRAEDKLRLSRCDSCGRMREIDNMTRVLSDEQVEEKILCNDCNSDYIDEECPNCERTIKKSERVNDYCIYCEPLNQYNTSSHRTKSQEYKSTYKAYTHSGSVESRSSGYSTEVSRAMDILEINEPITRDKVKKAFRDKTKDTHPDMPTGSKEQFKRAEEAKYILLEALEN